MSRKRKRRRHVPLRTCVSCRTPQAKGALVRIVRTPEGTVMVDETGKRSGRGAYLCPERRCWEAALTQRQLERALKVKLALETKTHLMAYAAGLPPISVTEPAQGEGAEKGANGDE